MRHIRAPFCSHLASKYFVLFFEGGLCNRFCAMFGPIWEHVGDMFDHFGTLFSKFVVFTRIWRHPPVQPVLAPPTLPTYFCASHPSNLLWRIPPFQPILAYPSPQPILPPPAFQPILRPPTLPASLGAPKRTFMPVLADKSSALTADHMEKQFRKPRC